VLEEELIKFSITSSNLNSLIEGNLAIPDNPIGIVVFGHGSASSRSSQRNQLISEKLHNSRIATLLFDLLSYEEQEFDAQLEKKALKIPGMVLNKFNIFLLAERLSMVTDWVMNSPRTKNLHIGYFASSTGGAAALMSASIYDIVSVVIRSGRTDLIETRFLDQIVSPCLFVVGSKEKTIVRFNKETIKKLINSKEKKLSIIEGASHLFEEEGTMEEVAEISTHWLIRNFNLHVNSENQDK
jgi:dienelactone hydrolase